MISACRTFPVLAGLAILVAGCVAEPGSPPASVSVSDADQSAAFLERARAMAPNVGVTEAELAENYRVGADAATERRNAGSRDTVTPSSRRFCGLMDRHARTFPPSATTAKGLALCAGSYS